MNAIGASPSGHGTALAYALTRGPPTAEAVRKLIEAGADVNAGANNPLFHAITNDSHKAIKMLLKAGADPRQPHRGRPLLSIAVECVYEINFEIHDTRPFIDAVAALVAVGGRCWDEVPIPCPRLERALPAVCATEPQVLPELFGLLETHVKARIRCTLLLLHRCVPEKRLRGKILTATLAEEEGAVPLEDWLPDTILDKIRTLNI